MSPTFLRWISLGRRPLYVQLVVLTALLGGDAGGASAQVIHGRVLDDADNRPVPTALVRLQDADGVDLDFTMADSLGRFEVQAPEPGEFRLMAERLGYEPYATPLLEARQREGSYAVELLMRRAPLPIPGLTVTAERRAELERAVQLIIGVSPKSLRTPPIHRAEIEDHIARGHNLVDLARWSDAPIVVRQTQDGPCLQYRARGCMPVFLNGMRVRSEAIAHLPLEMVETIVIMGPGESIAHPAAVLLYTSGWLR